MHTATLAVDGHCGAILLLRCAKALAIIGGILFVLMVGMSLVSIVGRKIWSAPINGDLEILQMGTGIAAAAFFPYCTMQGEHLRVEFFTAHCSQRLRSAFDAFANFLLAAAMALLTWRTLCQAIDMMGDGEISILRGIPIWIPVSCLIPSLGFTAVCAMYCACVHLMTSGKKI